ncbi:hypothetical protein RMATCC62417_11598 [Rhizopus microsporus]|nr:hypothetical protein RMATCC62417_11598 [Rhizopus microsporus]
MNQPNTDSHLSEETSSRRTSNAMADMEPPFLVRTKTKEEIEQRRQKYKEQQDNKHKRGPYSYLGQLYSKYSTSYLLENKSATARDHLANERTFLAWLRTSLSLITVGVAITQLYHLSPESMTNRYTKAGKSVGATFVVFSIVFLYFANARYFHTQIALTKGQFPASRGAVIFGSTCILAVLIAMFVIILLDLN